MPTPVGKPLVEHRPVEYDLVLGRERSGRQDAVAQFGERHCRGAAFADDHGGGGIGGAHGDIERCLHRQQHRHDGSDRIAGAGDIAHLYGISGDVQRRMTVDMQRHAFLAAGDQHGIAFDDARELSRRFGDLGFARHRAMHRRSQFLAVRGDKGCASVDFIIVTFRIDHDRFAEPARFVDDRADDALRQHALGVIRQHHRAALRQRRFGLRNDRGLAFGARRLRRLPVRPHQVRRMVLGHETHFARGVPSCLAHEMGNDRPFELGKGIVQCPRGVVLADQAYKNAPRPKRSDVARDIAGAADLDLATHNREHRRRRLRRNARDFAIDEIVEHQIADAENGLLRYELEGIFKIEHACCRRAKSRPRSTIAIGTIEITSHIASPPLRAA